MLSLFMTFSIFFCVDACCKFRQWVLLSCEPEIAGWNSEVKFKLIASLTRGLQWRQNWPSDDAYHCARSADYLHTVHFTPHVPEDDQHALDLFPLVPGEPPPGLRVLAERRPPLPRGVLPYLWLAVDRPDQHGRPGGLGRFFFKDQLTFPD